MLIDYIFLPPISYTHNGDDTPKSNRLSLAVGFKVVLHPEDGTFVPQHVGDTPSIVMFNEQRAFGWCSNTERNDLTNARNLQV